MREPLTGRVSRVRIQVVRSGPVGERATPTALRAQGPLPLGQDPASVPRGDELYAMWKRKQESR